MEENSDKITDKRLKNLKPPYKKGETGNPDGRPLGQRNYSTIYREALIKLATLNGKTAEELEDEIVSAGIMLARKGDYRYYKDTLDRLHGTATNKNDLTSNGKTIQFLPTEVIKKIDDNPTQ